MCTRMASQFLTPHMHMYLVAVASVGPAMSQELNAVLFFLMAGSVVH